ncbi:MAG: YHYH domain-containing protein [Burkholderiaceae bacterium]
MARFKTPLLTAALSFLFAFSTASLTPAALAHDDGGGAQGCHSHESSGEHHCH